MVSPVRKTTRHLDPAAILADNAKAVADAASHTETYRGPQMTFHRKPNAGGGPCDVCGCPGLRLGVEHRALGFGETGTRSRYVKIRHDIIGHDVAEMHLDADGRGV